MDRTRVVIVSGGDEVRYRSYVNQSIYARERGFTYHLGIGLAQGVSSPYYYKFATILEVLPHFEWAVWLDDDVYITDMAGSRLESLIAQAEDRNAYVVAAEGVLEPDGCWSHINSGVLVLRNDPRTFELLADSQAIDLDALREVWDDNRDGLFTRGDQDTIWWALNAKPHLRDGLIIVGHRELNSRPHHYDGNLDYAFAAHFCGSGDKPMRIGRFAKQFGLGQELVPEPLLDKWSVKKRAVMTLPEIWARQGRWSASLFARRVRKKIDFVRATGRWK